MRARIWMMVHAVACLGCGTAPPPPLPPPPAPTPAASVSVTAPDAGSAPVASLVPGDAEPAEGAAPASTPGVSFERAVPIPVPDPPPHVEIEFPILEKPIRVAKAPGYRVRLSVQHWPLGRDGAGIQLALDDAGPRVFTRLDQPIRLADLLPEDRTLAAGPHRLFAVAVHGNGEMVKPEHRSSRAPFSTVRFHVGARGEPEPEAPRLVYSRPRGTYNGEAAADRILLDFYVLNAELGREGFGVDVCVTGSNAEWKTELRQWAPLVIRGLPSGDFRITLQLIDREGSAVSGSDTHVSRSITINRDAPVDSDAGP